MKTIYRMAALSIGIAAAAASQAGTITYEVTNYNGGAGGHSLWTNRDYSKDRTFDATKGLTYQVNDNDTQDQSDDWASLSGSVVATGTGQTAQIDLRFRNSFSELDLNQQHYKREQGLPYYQLLANAPTFWGEILGAITIGDKVYDVDRNVVKDGKSFTAQTGLGANAKSPTEFGLSTWIQTCQRAGVSLMGASDCMASHHWDINVGLIRPPAEVQRPAAVPEPAMISLMFAGMAGLWLSRRKKNA